MLFKCPFCGYQVKRDTIKKQERFEFLFKLFLGLRKFNKDTTGDSKLDQEILMCIGDWRDKNFSYNGRQYNEIK